MANASSLELGLLINSLFNKYKWPIIDVSRKSVEETAASILKIFEINKNK